MSDESVMTSLFFSFNMFLELSFVHALYCLALFSFVASCPLALAFIPRFRGDGGIKARCGST